MQGAELCGRAIHLEYGSTNSKIMFVQNLSVECSNNKIRSQFPECTAIALPRDADGELIGIGFVEFETNEKMVSAINAKQGEVLQGRSLNLEILGQNSQGTTTELSDGITVVPPYYFCCYCKAIVGMLFNGKIMSHVLSLNHIRNRSCFEKISKLGVEKRKSEITVAEPNAKKSCLT